MKISAPIDLKFSRQYVVEIYLLDEWQLSYYIKQLQHRNKDMNKQSVGHGTFWPFGGRLPFLLFLWTSLTGAYGRACTRCGSYLESGWHHCILHFFLYLLRESMVQKTAAFVNDRLFSPIQIHKFAFKVTVFFLFEPVREKTNTLGFDQARHKPGCIVTEDV